MLKEINVYNYKEYSLDCLMTAHTFIFLSVNFTESIEISHFGWKEWIQIFVLNRNRLIMYK